MVVNFNPGPAKLQVTKTLKEELHLGLKEAKEFADDGRFVCSEEDFPRVKAALENAGAGKFEVL